MRSLAFIEAIVRWAGTPIWVDLFGGNTATDDDNWVMYVVDITSQQWVMMELAGDAARYGGGYSEFRVRGISVPRHSGDSLSDTQKGNFFNGLRSSRVVVALTPDRTFTPTYGNVNDEPPPPTAPSSVSAGAATSTSLTFTWAASTGATTHGYQYKKSSDASWEAEQSTNWQSATLTGLEK